MIRIALISLLHDRAKLGAALAGVAFAAALTLVQVGLYVGFLDSSSSLIRHIGGEVWVMARGTEVLDNGEALSASASTRPLAHPCVASARPVVLSFASIRKASGARDTVMLVGAQSRPDAVVPWTFIDGLPPISMRRCVCPSMVAIFASWACLVLPSAHNSSSPIDRSRSPR
jgi:putative ABC transport system permease protein